MNSRLVYSTETGSICRKCGKPAVACRCKKKQATHNKPQSGYPDDGVVRIRREVKGRKGKTATVIIGLSLNIDDLKEFAKGLKQQCGAGGSVKDAMIVIQGEHCQTILDEIKKLGYNAKIAGG